MGNSNVLLGITASNGVGGCSGVETPSINNFSVGVALRIVTVGENWQPIVEVIIT